MPSTESEPAPTRDPQRPRSVPTHTGTGDPRTRLLTLPHLKSWILVPLLLAAVVLAIGLTAKLLPGFTPAELTVDQDLSRHHSAFLTLVAMTLNYLFAPLAGAIGIAVVCLVLLVLRRSPVNAFAFGAIACLGWVASETFKLLIGRQRPVPALLADPLAPETGSNSFPSGHVAFAVALAFALYFLARGTKWQGPVALLGVALPLVVAWSRLYVGVHYPTDVIASFFASTAAVLLFAGLWNRFAPLFLARLTFLARFGPIPGPAPSTKD